MSLLSSTAYDDEDLSDDDKENHVEFPSMNSITSVGSRRRGGGSGGVGQPHRRNWKLLSSSSDDALQQRSSGQHAQRSAAQQLPLQRSAGQQLQLSTGHKVPPVAVFAASPDRILLPLGSSPVLNEKYGAGLRTPNSGSGADLSSPYTGKIAGPNALNTGNRNKLSASNIGNGAGKDPRLRDVDPVLAASPNILGSGGSKSGPRVIHAKSNAHPMGTVFCLAYTPPNR